jgi:hypothetical protein
VRFFREAARAGNEKHNLQKKHTHIETCPVIHHILETHESSDSSISPEDNSQDLISELIPSEKGEAPF